MHPRYLPFLYLFVAGLLLSSLPAQAQNQVPDQAPELIVLRSANRPLASLQAAADAVRTRPPVRLYNEVPNFDFRPDTRAQGGGNLDRDPLLKPFQPFGPTTVLTQFDGADNTDNGFNITPPDTDGDVSSDAVDRYVQMINLVTTVFDKNGTVLGGGPFFSSAFWEGFGGLCETNDNGDPVVLYDETSDRWLVSQFAFNSTSSPPWLQCIAVSQTSNPLGAYNRYAYDFASFGFNDYPKFGFTTDDITMMANLFIPSFAGTFIGTADKNCMYSGGASCTLVGANLGGSEFGFVAGDLDDPAGTGPAVPALFATAMRSNGLFDVWEVDPDYATPSNTTIARISRVPIASFDSDLCFASRERCIPHPGSGDNLETLSGRLMHRLQIRRFSTYLTMVASHTVDVGGGRAGIRWYELRSTTGGASWSLHQQGTYGPNDGLHRWMPSIAMNAAGDIGLGYMVSNATTPVNIRVTGQTAAQSGSGTFDADEAVCRAGLAGSDWSGRAGDYSATNIDPDSDSFWHTNEFGRSTAFRGWGTAVCEFALDSTPVNQPPVVTITVPADGSSFQDGTSITFTGTATDPEDGNLSGSLAWNSSLDGAIGSGASFSTSTLSVGTHTITAEVTDSGGLSGSDQITVTITPVSTGDDELETVVVSGVSSAGWTTVNLSNTFTSPVVVCSAVYAGNTLPEVVRMRNASGSSFEIRLQNPSGAALSGEEVHCLVVEEGAWQLPDGTNIEAQQYTSTVTDQNNAWVGEAQGYQQSYTNPAVLGQVMTTNDAGWSVFWSQGSSRTSPPSAAVIRTGKHVGEDTDVTRANETVGFIVVESNTGTVGGVPYETALGSDSILGVGDAPPYSYPFSQTFGSTPAVFVVTMAGMDGGNGGWGTLFGSAPVSTTSINLAVDEDQVGDAERVHISEQIGYVVFEQNVSLSLSGQNAAPTVTITAPADGSSFTEVDLITFTGTATDPEDGNLSGSLAWSSDLDGAIGSGASFDTDALSVGTHVITAGVTDSGGEPGSDQITVTITPFSAGGTLETVVASGVSSAGWTTVNLANTYTSPVVVCSVVYANNTLPEVVRMRNAAAGSFEIQLQNPSGSALSGEEVHCLVVEEGAWQLPDGTNIEAQQYTSTVTDRKNAWVGEAQGYLQSYTSPVVLGQVMTSNDLGWSVFWSQGSSRTSPPSGTVIRTGKHVGEDTDGTRANETVGFVVIEAGSGTLGGTPYEAQLGSDIVRGITNSPPYNYTFGQTFSGAPAFAVATQAAMDGGDGGWAVLFGASPLAATTIGLAIDEDQISNSERNHTTEQVGYLVFGQNVNLLVENLEALAGRNPQLEGLNAAREATLPEAFALTDVYPNPFSRDVTIRYSVPEAAHVRMVVYNTLGQHVQTLVNATQPEGYHTVTWDGRPANGSTLGSGVYVIRFESAGFSQTRTVLFVK